MRVLIGGGSGFVGRYLTYILRKQGHEVLLVSRSRTAKESFHFQEADRITWDDLEYSGLPEKTDAVVNLAGQLLMDPSRRWDNEFFNLVYSSRIDTTRALAGAISKAAEKPKVFVFSSAIGYYDYSDTAEYTEDSEGGEANDMARLCRDWEAAAQLPQDCSTRLVTVRIGLVLGREGGIIKNMILPFWLGAGGRIASGKQPFPWVHAQDAAGIISHAIENEHVKGVLNATAPQLIDNAQFTSAFASALWRPAFFPVPWFALEVVFGKERAAMMINGQKVIPKRTLESGYEFKYPDIESACKEFGHIMLNDFNF